MNDLRINSLPLPALGRRNQPQQGITLPKHKITFTCGTNASFTVKKNSGGAQFAQLSEEATRGSTATTITLISYSGGGGEFTIICHSTTPAW